MNESAKFFWTYSQQRAYVGELICYILDKEDCGLIERAKFFWPQHRLAVDTYAGIYSTVLFPEIARLSEDWTKYSVSPWLRRGYPTEEVWLPFVVVQDKWKNSPIPRKFADEYARIYIDLIYPEGGMFDE
jgi:hypothetical protein